MSEFTLTRIDRTRYRPTKQAEDFLGYIRSAFNLGDKATVARLALGRSLAEGAPPKNNEIPSQAEMGYAIEGTHLFGEEEDLWACLIAGSGQAAPQTPQEFRALVEAHWHRGARLLQEDYKDVGESDVEFVVRLAGMVPNRKGAPRSGGHPVPESGGPIEVKFGSTSRDPQSGETLSYVVNEKGTSPHMAIMGKTRSGKSRTGLDIAQQIVNSTDVPFVLIDPKGEFVRDGQFVQKQEWGGRGIDSILPGAEPLDVPKSPVPLDFLQLAENATEHDRAQLAIAFRDSFQKCLRARGDVALDMLRASVNDLLQNKNAGISLEDIRQAYQEKAEDEGRSAGSIAAKLSEIVSLGMFEPRYAPAEFFTRRWVIGFGNASDEPKKLAIFLLLDALNAHLMHMEDSGVDEAQRRSLRHLLVVDEAREILSYKHGALSSLIRRSASKGGLTMLLSQGPDDFDQEEDDFLEQMGTVGVFALSSSSVKSLSGAFGRKVRIEDFADKALPTGTALVKLPGQGARKILAWE
jgi:DNA sulfur modification protein DndE